MKKKEFIKLLEDYDWFQQNCHRYCEMGIDLYESEFPTWTITEKFFDFIISQEYNEFGIDWINWFIHENDMGRKGYEAWNGEKLICQNINELYSYIEQYKK